MQKTTLVALLLVVVGLAVVAEETAFPNGVVDVSWDEAAVLLLQIRFNDVAPPTDRVRTWVVTDLAHRFADGVFAWQLHYSEEHESVIVISNDFLMTGSFTFEQLGIEVIKHEPGRELALRIPRDGPIPNFAVPGDLIEVHALWKQMAPVVAVSLPSLGSVAGIAGAGAGLDGAAVGEPSTELLPPHSTYTIGETIRHRFVLIDSVTGESDPWATASYSLVLDESGQKTWLRYLLISKDPDTGVFELEIDTSDLRAGFYDLYMWASTDGGTSVHKRIEIREP